MKNYASYCLLLLPDRQSENPGENLYLHLVFHAKSVTQIDEQYIFLCGEIRNLTPNDNKIVS